MTEPSAPGTRNDVHELFMEVLHVARCAPSGNNVQPRQLLMLRPRVVELLIAEVLRNTSDQCGDRRIHGIEELRAPLSVLCLIDQRLGRGSTLDYGMFLQNMRLSAASRGMKVRVLHDWSAYSDIIGRMTPLTDHHRVLCALAIGPADQTSELSETTPVAVRWVEWEQQFAVNP